MIRQTFLAGLLLAAGCTYNGVLTGPVGGPSPIPFLWTPKPANMLVNNTVHQLTVYHSGRMAVPFLGPGQVYSFTPADGRAPMSVVACDTNGVLIGSAFHHYSFCGEVWMVAYVVPANP